MQNILNVSVLAFNFKAVFLRKKLLQNYKLYNICGNINVKKTLTVYCNGKFIQVKQKIVPCVCIFLGYENFFNYLKN